MAESREEAGKAFDLFIDKYAAKYPQATQCLEKDRYELPRFYHFSAENWKHIRTTNPIESTLQSSSIQPRDLKDVLHVSERWSWFFKLIKDAEKPGGRLGGSQHLAKIISGTRLIDGCEEIFLVNS